MIKTIGRDKTCDHIIFDPERRVSRVHLQVEKVGECYYLEDLSSNGTFVDGIKLNKGVRVKITGSNEVILGGGYLLNLKSVFNNNSSSSLSDNRATIIDKKQKSVSVDLHKTTIGDLLELESSDYISIGRSKNNKIVLSNHPRVSSTHCKMRQIGNDMIEVVDLGSTNGTFVDGKRLIAGSPGIFTNNAKVNLAGEITLNLVKVFPGMQLVKRKDPIQEKGQQAPLAQRPRMATPEELEDFMQLERVFDEYDLRLKSASNEGSSVAMTGQVAGIVAGLALSAAIPIIGPFSVLFSGGGAVLGRYLAGKKTNEIRTDLSFDKAFLEAYSCPRCNESFQKKPWITIRECNKCKVVFRS
ncbi:MAG: FHA domain-containing protein [Flavobacteriia bacterium]|nr:FHA domain-containing protein [Flavobacteriia bacterium]